MLRPFRTISLSLVLVSTILLNGCSKNFLTISSRAAEFQKNPEPAPGEPVGKLMTEHEKRVMEEHLAGGTALPEQQVSSPGEAGSQPAAAPVLPVPENRISESQVKSLVGNWDYDILGQKIGVNVQEQNQLFSTTVFFNGNQYEASGKVAKVTDDSLVVNGDYYGEPVSIKLEPLSDQKMNFTFLDGGKNIPSFIKGIPLEFSKK